MQEKPKTQLQVEAKILNELTATVNSVVSFKAELLKSQALDTTSLVSFLLFGAFILDASDLHFETEAEQVKIRLRLDGALFESGFLNKEEYLSVLNRLKLFAGMKLNITQKPQDGRFALLADTTEIEVRASTLPSEFGETFVLRLLNPKKLLDLNNLGLRKDLAAILRQEIQKPNGMIISTGPTGSGKTTTLYGVLKEINKPEIKIITIEDPIEYRLDGVSQSQIDETRGYSFASGLATIVRQDPDVILVGEIRDEKTAKIALQAALTGHLVLTTLHTNDAAGTIARLQALGEKPENIAPALNLIIAQRLVRKICPHCSQKKQLSAEEIKFFKEQLKDLINQGLCGEPNRQTQILQAKGCQKCNQIGYKGRIGVYEFLLINDEMENFIIKNSSIADLKKQAIQKGMTTMLQDGLIKVLDKNTSLEEVLKETYV